jgi:hypothetical protein
LTDNTGNHFSHIKKLTQIGAALSSEKNLDRLLEMIVDGARLLKRKRV